MRARTLLFLALAINCRADLDSGLAGIWTFRGNSEDSSGNGNHAFLNGATSTADRFGAADSAIQLAGGSQRIEIAASPLLAPVQGTVAIWVNASTWQTSDGFVDLIGKDGVSNRQWVIQVSPAGRLRTALFTAAGEFTKDSTESISTGRWHQIVMTWNGALQAGFVDGKQVVEMPTTGAVAGGGNPVRIGGGYPGAGTSMIGSVDDVRIYSRALSPSEVQELYWITVSATPHAAAATAVLTGQFVTSAQLTDPGWGYSSTPSVKIVGGGGSGATAVAVMVNGIVTAVTITDAGAGYSSPPRILIDSPPFVPTTSIAVSRVKIVSHVRINHSYVLESSPDMEAWTEAVPPFTAETEEVAHEILVTPGNRFFRIKEIP